MEQLSEKELEVLRNWRYFQDKVNSFQNNANLFLFEQIYGELDAFRLMDAFRNRCNNSYLVFETFLTREQLNKTLIFISKL